MIKAIYILYLALDVFIFLTANNSKGSEVAVERWQLLESRPLVEVTNPDSSKQLIYGTVSSEEIKDEHYIKVSLQIKPIPQNIDTNEFSAWVLLKTEFQHLS